MANTKNTKNTKSTQNKTGKSSSSGNSRSRSGRKSKNSSDDTLKFLLVLVIAGIAIALIFFSQDKEEQTGNVLTGTPAPTNAAVTQAVQPTEAPQPTRAQEQNTPVPTPTSAPVEEPTSTPEPTATSTPAPTATPTPTPTPALSAAEAEELVHSKVDTSVYSIQLVSESLRVGNGSYYQFGAIANQEFVYPFLVVDKATGELSCYDSTAETVFDFTTFPIKGEATPTPVPTKAPEGRLTAEEAYQVLCTYSRESLHIAKAVSEYDAEYGSELTLIDGVDCYRINLSEFSNGKVRNRGEFYVSVDGTKCFYIDSNTNEFIKAEK
ncbi:MAG: hypothetical protein J6A77_00610 [Lachnospiraceae bacterium]|nr:hypothetical protein [Lachnospiraceae bacterium]